MGQSSAILRWLDVNFEAIMRVLILICIGIAATGIAVSYFMGESTPDFIVPLIISSGLASILLLLVSVTLKIFRSRQKYQCLSCGTILGGGDPVQMGNVCPNCRGSTFRRTG